jgi:hypothetical protein
MATVGDDDEIRYADADVDLRRLTAGFGGIHGDLVERIPPLLALDAEARARVATDGLAQLRAQGVITDAEVAQLTRLTHTLGVVEFAPPERARQVAAIQQELVAANAGLLALAIVNIAANSSINAAKVFDEAGTGADIGDLSTPGEVACACGIIGATAGLAFGPAGVLVGAAAGAGIGYVGAVLQDSALS